MGFVFPSQGLRNKPRVRRVMLQKPLQTLGIQALCRADRVVSQSGRMVQLRTEKTAKYFSK
jgi:hypothetical protein